MLTLSNDNLIAAVRSLVKHERRITREILDHINEVDSRRLYADLVFSSIFEWLVKDLGYSESAAYSRMQAARLLRAVPQLSEKIESGALALTTLSKVQTIIRVDEKRTGEKISAAEKADILKKVESCTGREADFILATHFPELSKVSADEKVRPVGEDRVSVQVTFTKQQYDKLKRIAELLSHTLSESSNAKLLEAAMDVFLERKNPLTRLVRARVAQNDTAAEVPQTAKFLKPSVRNAVFRKSGGQCECHDRKNDRRCAGRHFLEVNHIRPRVLGGTNETVNLTALCRTHHLLMAERKFGRPHIESFRRHD